MKHKSQVQKYRGEQIREQSTETSGSLRSVLADVAKETQEAQKSIVSQLFGIEKTLREGVEMNLGAPQPREKKPIPREHLEYFRQIETTEIISGQKAENQLKRQIEEIQAELEQLKDVTVEMQAVVKHSSTDRLTEKPGKYHLTFFEWALSMVRGAKARMQEGVSWAKIFDSKKSQKQYWSMAKKHGTSFTQHHDRGVATQTG